MRTLSADLLALQSTPDAEATVTARCKRRGTFASDPLAWRPIFLHTAANLPYGDAGVTAAACACAENGAVVRVLRSAAAGKVGVQRLNVLGWNGSGQFWPSAAEAALTATPVQVATLTSTDTAESTPGVGRESSTVVLAYGDGPKIFVAISGDDGCTWGSPQLVYDGTGAYTRFTDLCVLRWPGYLWTVLCTACDAAGALSAISFYNTGGGWAFAGGALPAGPWRVAGARMGPGAMYVYLWGVNSGWSALVCYTWYWGGAVSFVDRTGPGGGSASGDGVQLGRVRLGEAAGAYLFALQERAVKGYWFVSSLYGLPGSLDIEEPVFLGDADTGVATSEYFTPVQAGRRAWLVGSGGVYASAQSDDAANLAVRTLAPVSYTYTVEANGGGVLQLEIDRWQSGEGAPEGFGTISAPEVYVGDILWLDRTLRNGSQTGTMTLAFRVLQAAYSRDRVRVLAADALGVLAHMRARRPKLLAAGERQRMADVDALCHWCGLDVTGSGTLPGAAEWSPGFTWPANETGLGALRRYLMDQVTALRSAGAGPDGTASTAHTAVQLLELPAAASYAYVSPEGRAEAGGGHEIASWTLELDSRQARLLVANGLAAAGDPLGDSGAKGWAITAARPLPGSRPFPLSLTDYALGVDDGSVQGLAVGQAQWLLFGLPVGEIEATANLGVELYDVVTVDQMKARVVGIAETWEQGRLRQRLRLAEVDGWGVSVG